MSNEEISWRWAFVTATTVCASLFAQDVISFDRGARMTIETIKVRCERDKGFVTKRDGKIYFCALGGQRGRKNDA